MAPVRTQGWVAWSVVRQALVAVLAGIGLPWPGAATLPPATQSPLRVIGLGDSVTSGYGCDCTDFVRRYARDLAAATGRGGGVANEGAPGLTTGQLVAQLRDDEAVRSTVAASAVVVITTGANDVGAALARWRDGTCRPACPSGETAAVGPTLRTALGLVRQLRGGRPTLVLVTGYWNVFEDGVVGDADYGPAFARWSDRVTVAVNRQISAAAAAAGPQVRYVDLRAAFTGSRGDRDPTALLQADGDHPNAAGHALIARTLEQAVPFAQLLDALTAFPFSPRLTAPRRAE